MTRWIALLPLVALAACGETGTTAARPSRLSPVPLLPIPGRFPANPVPGPSVSADAVRGQTARALIGQYGKPSIDLQEGLGRKLQFAGPVCVADVYLYAPTSGREQVAKHLDTRTRDGRPAEPSSCLTALRK